MKLALRHFLRGKRLGSVLVGFGLTDRFCGRFLTSQLGGLLLESLSVISIITSRFNVETWMLCKLRLSVHVAELASVECLVVHFMLGLLDQEVMQLTLLVMVQDIVVIRVMSWLLLVVNDILVLVSVVVGVRGVLNGEVSHTVFILELNRLDVNLSVEVVLGGSAVLLKLAVSLFMLMRTCLMHATVGEVRGVALRLSLELVELRLQRSGARAASDRTLWRLVLTVVLMHMLVLLAEDWLDVVLRSRPSVEVMRLWVDHVLEGLLTAVVVG